VGEEEWEARDTSLNGSIDSDTTDTGSGEPDPVDDDEDGVPVDEDCDDNNPAVGAIETWYSDADGDGFGDPLVPLESCTQPADYVLDSRDCDDASAEIHPDADELWGDSVDIQPLEEPTTASSTSTITRSQFVKVRTGKTTHIVCSSISENCRIK